MANMTSIQATQSPAGFYVSNKLATQVSGLESANTSIQAALNMIGVADTSLNELNDIMGQIRDLVQESTNGYLTPKEREANQKKINELFAQAQKIKENTSYNNNKLFSNTTKLDKNATYFNNTAEGTATPVTVMSMEGRSYTPVTTAAGQTLTTVGYTATDESQSVILNEGEESQGTDTQSVILSEGEESQGEESQEAEAPVMMMMSRSMSTFAMTRSVSAEDLGTSGSLTLASKETKTVMINGMIYTIENTGSEQTMNYSTDANGQITISGAGTNWSSYIVITAADGQDDNIKLSSRYAKLYTGDGNDTVNVTNGGYGTVVELGEGNNNITINTDDTYVTAGSGNDTFTVNSTGEEVYIIKGGGSDTVNGSNGTEIVVDELLTLNFTEDQTRTVTIGGKSYSITYSGYSDATLSYGIDSATGKVSFYCTDDDYWEITAASGQVDNINVKLGRDVIIDTGDCDDTVMVAGSDAVVNTGDGNDTVSFASSWGVLDTGAGDDIVNLIGTYNSSIATGVGNDTITLSNASYLVIDTGTDNDTVNIDSNSSRTEITLNEGTNEVTNAGSYMTINGGTGDDTYTLTGNQSSTTISKNGGTDTVNGATESTKIYETVETVSLASGASKTVTLGGKTYTITSEYYSKADVLCSLDSNGCITFSCDTTFATFEIVAADGQDDNINNQLYGSTINLGDGNNTVVNSGQNASIYYGNGTNQITNTGRDATFIGSGGTDTYNLNSNAASTTIVKNNDNAVVNGATADTQIYDEGGVVEFVDNVQGETQTLTINGKTYTVTNLSYENNKFVYGYNKNSNEIAILSDNFSITAAEGQTDNLILAGGGLNVNTGDGDDTVNSIGGANTIDLGAGNNIIINNGFSAQLDLSKGINTVTNTGEDVTVLGSNDDTINSSMFVHYVDEILTLEFSTLDPQDVTIGGKTYTVTPYYEGAVLQYGIDSKSGMVTFIGESFTITSADGQDDYLYVSGYENIVQTGDGNDRIITSTNSYYNQIDGGEGNDSVVCLYNDGAYVDETTVEAYQMNYSGYGYGEIVVGANASITAIINNRSYDIQNTDGTGGVIAYYVDAGQVSFNTNGGSYSIVMQAQSGDWGTEGTVSLAAGQTVEAIINGNTYTITNNTEVDHTFEYSTDANGQISFKQTITEPPSGSGNDISIVAADGQVDNIYLKDGTWYLDTGDMDDTIVAGKGDSTYLTNNVVVHGGDGADNITLCTTTGTAYGDAGDDTITVDMGSSNTYSGANSAYGGNGDDTIYVNSWDVGTISGGNHNDRIILDEDVYYGSEFTPTFDGGNGTDYIQDTGASTLGNVANVINSEGYIEDLGTSGSLSLAIGETKTVKINGLTYTFANNSTYNAANISFSTDANGIVTLCAGESGGNVTITAADGQEDKIKITGANNSHYEFTVNTGDYNDTVYISTYGVTLDLGSGNDNVVVESSDDDYKNTIDGGAGTDTYVDNSGTTYNTFTNFENDQQPTTITIAAGATETVTVDGKKYDIFNGGTASATVTYSLSEGQITFDSSGALNLTAHENQEDNLVLEGTWGTISTNDQADNVTIVGSVHNVLVGAGNDNIIVNGEVTGSVGVSGGAGNDTITVSGSVSFVQGGTDDDTITITEAGNAYDIWSDDGNDTITVEGNTGNVFAGSGNDTITVTSTGTVTWKAYGEGGDDTITVDGVVGEIWGDNTYTDTTGKDTIIVNSDGNTVHGGNGDDTITVNGKNNTVYGGSLFEGTYTDDSTNDKAYNNGTGNTFNGVETIVGNSGTINVKQGETVTVEIDGKKYDIENSSDETRTVTYSLNEDVITFNGSEYGGSSSGYSGLQLTAHDGQTDNIRLEGNWYTVDTGDGNDTITVAGTIARDARNDGGYLDSGDGNDTINVLEGAYISSIGYYQGADTGNDNVTIAGEVFGVYLDKAGTINVTSTGEVHNICGSDEADNITIDGTVYGASLGAGADTIIVNGTVNGSVATGEGNDNVTINGTLGCEGAGNNALGTDAGDDTVTINGTVNGFVTLDDGNDNITINSDGNTVIGGNGDDTVTLNDKNNIAYGGHGGVDNSTNDTIYNNSTDNTYSEFENVYALDYTTITVAAGETITVEIDGKKYDITNISSDTAESVTYALNDGAIEFTATNSRTDGEGNLTLTAHSKQQDNLIVDGFHAVYTEDWSDTVTVKDGATIYGGINTGAGNDTVTVDGVAINVYTGDGDDNILVNGAGTIGYINAGEGDNVINIVGTSGNIYSGTGDDTITVAEGANTGDIDTGAGNDDITINGNAGVITAGDGNDTINVIKYASAGGIDSGAGHDNVTVAGNIGSIGITTGAGDDVIDIQKSATISGDIEAGDDDDEITIAGTVNATVSAGNGTENTITVTSTGSAWAAYGGNGVDTIVVDGNLAPNENKSGVWTEGGNDNITVNTDNVVVDGGDGNDTINVTGDNNSIDGWTGNDSITVTGDNNLVSGYLDDDTIIVTGKDNNIHGNTGDDNITVNGDNNSVYGEQDDDTVILNGKNNIAMGGHDVGTDTSLNDTVYINDTGNTVSGFENVYGNYGTLEIAAGQTVTVEIDGKKYDIYNQSDDTTQTVTYALNEGKITFDGSSKDDLILTAHSGQADNISVDGFREVYTMDGNDTIVVEEDSTIWSAYAGSGDNTIIVRGEADTIDGGSGKDNITVTETGRVGISISGQGGNDTITVAGESGRISSGEGDDNITISGTANYFVLGEEGNDNITITETGNAYGVDGNAGNDTITVEGSVGNSVAAGEGEDTVIVNGTVDGGVYGYAGNDNITITETGNAGEVGGNAGNDTITVEGTVNCDIEGGEGNDIITVTSTGSAWNAYGQEGDDTIVVDGAVETIWGDDTSTDGSVVEGGNDTIIINSDGSTVNAGNGDDTVTLNGKNNVAYGGSETTDTSTNDTVYVNNAGNVTSGFENIYGNYGTLEIAAGETVTVEIDGKKYDIYNDSGVTQTLTYSLGDGDVITFDGGTNDSGNGLSITAHEGQEDKLNIAGTFKQISTGDMNDDITVSGTLRGSVYAGAGDDTVTVTETGTMAGSVFGEDGDDNITIAGTVSLAVYANAGNDNITITETGNAHSVYGDAGDDAITVEGSVEHSVTGDEGNDIVTITSTGSAWFAYGGADDDTVVVDGNVTGVVYGDGCANGASGNDNIIVNSDGNTIEADNGDDTITLNSKNNTVYGGAGGGADTSLNDTVYDNGTGNTYNGVEYVYGTNGTINIGAGKTVTVEIDGKKYDIVNTSDNALTATYSLKDGQITFDTNGGSHDTLNLIAHEGQDDNLLIKGEWSLVETGNNADNVTIADGAYIYSFDAGDGNDTITVEQGAALWSAYTGNGDNTVTIAGDVGDGVYAGSGNDTITINSDSTIGNISAGAGDDTITTSKDSYVSYIEAGAGNDNITVSGTVNGTVNGQEGDDTIIVDGTVSGEKGVVGDDGNDTITVTSTGSVIKNVEGGAGNDNVTVFGTVNGTVDGQEGEDVITVTESGVVYQAYGGADKDSIVIAGNAGIVAGDFASSNQVGADDVITITSTGTANTVSGEGGNDTITVEGTVTGDINACDGNDIITVTSTGSAWNAYGQEGDDTIVVDGSVGTTWGDDSSGVSGNDNITINSDGNTIIGGNGDDTVTLNGKNNVAYGGNETTDTSLNDTIYNNNVGNTFSGFENIHGNIGTIEVNAGETVTVEIDGKKYDIHNSSTNETRTVTYSFSEGVITFNGDENKSLQLTAHENQEDNLVIDGFATVNTGNLNDKLTIVDAGTINTGDGDDEVTTVYKFDSYIGIINTDDGNDTITIGKDSSISELNSGDGNDNINIIGDVRDLAGTGAGDDNITIAGTVSGSVYANAGNDTITVSGTVNQDVESDAGDDEITVTETGNVKWQAYGGAGNDTITIAGFANDVRGDDGNDSITITSTGVVNIVAGDYGDDTLIIDGSNIRIDSDSGVNSIYINGDNNTMGQFANGNDTNGTNTINISGNNNDIEVGSGNDTISISGSNNAVSAGSGDDKITITGDNNYTFADDGNDMTTIRGKNNVSDGGSGYDKVSNHGTDTTFSSMDELVDSVKTYNVLTNHSISDSSMYQLDAGLYLPDINIDVSSVESSLAALEAIDSMMLGLTTARVDLTFKSDMLNSIMKSNLTRISNLQNTQTTIKDAAVAQHYNELIRQAALLDNMKLLQSQLGGTTGSSNVLSLIDGIAS